MAIVCIKIIIFALNYCWCGILVACKFIILIRGIEEVRLFLLAASGFVVSRLDRRIALLFLPVPRRLVRNAFLFRGHGAAGSDVVVSYTTMATVSALIATVAAPAVTAHAAGG